MNLNETVRQEQKLIDKYVNQVPKNVFREYQVKAYN